MTSQRKIAANRSNSRRSSGPRTAEGKRKASGNSRKHGWAAMLAQRLPAASPEIEQLAEALCGDAQHAVVLAQARIVATNELMRRAMQLQKIRRIETFLAQVDEPGALELASPEIDRLERYEARMWTRQRRAMRKLLQIQRVNRTRQPRSPRSSAIGSTTTTDTS